MSKNKNHNDKKIKEELKAYIILKKCLNYGKLYKSEIPDFIDKENNIGIEATSCSDKDVEESIFLIKKIEGENINNVPKKNLDFIKNAGFDWEVDNDNKVVVNSFGSWLEMEPLEKIIKKKYQKLNKGHYQKLNSYDLYINSYALVGYDYEDLKEFFYKLDLSKYEKGYDNIIVYSCFNNKLYKFKSSNKEIEIINTNNLTNLRDNINTLFNYNKSDNIEVTNKIKKLSSNNGKYKFTHRR